MQAVIEIANSCLMDSVRAARLPVVRLHTAQTSLREMNASEYNACEQHQFLSASPKVVHIIIKTNRF